MKPAILVLLLCAGLARSEEEEEQQKQQAPDSLQILNQLIVANETKDVEKISMLMKDIAEVGKQAKAAEEVDPLAEALTTSLKICKGNHGTMLKIVDALGELRSKAGAHALKKIALKRKVKEGLQEELQAHALNSLGMLRDPKMVKGIADQCKQRSLIVAKAAYATFRHYGPSKGKVRKGIAEILMKRLEFEYPSASKQGGGSGKASGEAQKRWDSVRPVIVKSMQSICRQPTINDIENWREWWRENRKRAKTWKDEKA